MPVTCESCPSTSATYSWSSRSDSLCLAACCMLRAGGKESRETTDAVLEGDRRNEVEAIAQCRIGAAELDVLGHLAVVEDRHLDAERTRHRGDDGVNGYWSAAGQIDGAAERWIADDAQQRVNRIVDVHEVDQVLTVAADRELALTGDDGAEPSRRDLARRLVRTVGAEETDVGVARQRPAPLGEEGDVAFGRKLRDRIRQNRIHRSRGR